MTALLRRAATTVLVLLTVPAPLALVAGPDAGVQSKDGLVVCTSAPACDAGASVLARGGNAVDAAVATAFALAVTHPAAGNIGGGGFLLFRPAKGEPVAYDFREVAPSGSSPTMFMPGGRYDPKVHHEGYLSVGVP